MAPDNADPDATRPDGTDDPAASDASDTVASRLTLIEQQSLDARADAYAHLHEELRARLEGADLPERRD